MTLVAVITGGTSGMGLDVAQRLDESGLWKVHILGTNQQRGEEAAAPLNNTTFHQVNVTSYQEQATTFDKIFNEHQRLDFVFANAGKAPSPPINAYFAKHDTGIPPEPASMDLLNINFTGAIHTCYLAMHYFRRSPEETKGNRHLLLNSSIGGLYPCVQIPLYSAGKHGLVGFTRSVGKELWEEGVKVNAICPGVVITPLLTPEMKAIYAEKIRIPMENVTGIVLKILSGNQVTDSKGVRVPGEELYSQVILIVGKNYYFVDHPEYFDEETSLTHSDMMITQSEQERRS
ncbi:hypothetical protein N7493_007623 [Penicillium malachiteum]|uniref:NAD(P)-binding protein n=1 Tax=Penicillium malachiteum TaxID=1324776 RepID=A0AAD6MU50_9EURO|nr:hypothetical protein N7493_007623 [Penicillium malachiteum]